MNNSIAMCILVTALGLLSSCGEKQDPLGTDAGVDGTVTYTNDIKPLLDSNCVPCHDSRKAGAQRNGAPQGVNFDNYQDAKNSAAGANARIQAGTMPPTGPLDSEQKALFQAWIDQGTPE